MFPTSQISKSSRILGKQLLLESTDIRTCGAFFLAMHARTHTHTCAIHIEACVCNTCDGLYGIISSTPHISGWSKWASRGASGGGGAVGAAFSFCCVIRSDSRLPTEERRVGPVEGGATATAKFTAGAASAAASVWDRGRAGGEGGALRAGKGAVAMGAGAGEELLFPPRSKPMNMRAASCEAHDGLEGARVSLGGREAVATAGEEWALAWALALAWEGEEGAVNEERRRKWDSGGGVGDGAAKVDAGAAEGSGGGGTGGGREEDVAEVTEAAAAESGGEGAGRGGNEQTAETLDGSGGEGVRGNGSEKRDGAKENSADFDAAGQKEAVVAVGSPNEEGPALALALALASTRRLAQGSVG